VQERQAAFKQREKEADEAARRKILEKVERAARIRGEQKPGDFAGFYDAMARQEAATFGRKKQGTIFFGNLFGIHFHNSIILSS
jgi:hypothetical protein